MLCLVGELLFLYITVCVREKVIVKSQLVLSVSVCELRVKSENKCYFIWLCLFHEEAVNNSVNLVKFVSKQVSTISL